MKKVVLTVALILGASAVHAGYIWDQRPCVDQPWLPQCILP